MSAEPILILRDAAGRPTHAVVPWARALADGLVGPAGAPADDEDSADALLLADARADDDGFRLPLAFARRLTDGEHVVAVLRDYRGLSQADLAVRMDTRPNYISQIETRARRGARQAEAFAKALDAPVELLRGHL